MEEKNKSMKKVTFTENLTLLKYFCDLLCKPLLPTLLTLCNYGKTRINKMVKKQAGAHANSSYFFSDQWWMQKFFRPK